MERLKNKIEKTKVENTEKQNISFLDGVIERKGGLKRYFEREREIRKQKGLDSKIESLEKKSPSFLKDFLEKRIGGSFDAEVLATGLYKLRINVDSFNFPTLPEGYGFCGGAARSAMEKVLGLKDEHKYRDMDILYSGKEESQDLSRKISEEYMPEDNSHGYGVKFFSSNYFETRDFTVNEVYYENGNLFFTKKCLMDMLRGNIRITECEKETSYQGHPYFIKPKLLAKALRLVADKERVGDKADFNNQEVFQWQGIDSFHMALHLDRSLEVSYDSAMAYIGKLKGEGLVPDNLSSPQEVASYLQKETDFEFRFLGGDVLEVSEDITEKESSTADFESLAEEEEEHGGFGNLPKRERMGK